MGDSPLWIDKRRWRWLALLGPAMWISLYLRYRKDNCVDWPNAAKVCGTHASIVIVLLFVFFMLFPAIYIRSWHRGRTKANDNQMSKDL